MRKQNVDGVEQQTDDGGEPFGESGAEQNVPWKVNLGMEERVYETSLDFEGAKGGEWLVVVLTENNKERLVVANIPVGGGSEQLDSDVAKLVGKGAGANKRAADENMSVERESESEE